MVQLLFIKNNKQAKMYFTTNINILNKYARNDHNKTILKRL